MLENKIKSRYGKAPKLLNTQVCVVSLSDDGEIFYNGVTTIEERRKWLVEVWFIDSGATCHMIFQRE